MEKFPEGRICNSCGINLYPENWYKWSVKKKDYKCKSCVVKKQKASDNYRAKRKTDIKKKLFPLVLSRKISSFSADAKRRGLRLEYNYEEIGAFMKTECNYCGSNDSYNGLDRVDSSCGYLKGNTVPCCERCNRAKSSFSKDDFLNHCRKIIKHMEALK